MAGLGFFADGPENLACPWFVQAATQSVGTAFLLSPGVMTKAVALLLVSALRALRRAAPHTRRADCRWAALLADLPETRAREASERLKAPSAYSLLATQVSGGRPKIKTALKDATECMNLLKALDALRREEPFGGFCETLVALEQNSTDAQKAIELLLRARDAAQKVKAADFAEQGLKGPTLGGAILAAQIERIAELLE